MASATHTQTHSSVEDRPFAFGYMLLPTDNNPEDAAAQEREFQNEIASLNNLFAVDPYGGLDHGNPFPSMPSSMSTHEFKFSPPTVHGVDAVYFDSTSQHGHMSSMTAPYMGMHNPAFEFVGFDPANPYTPTGEVTHSFAGLNMAHGALGGALPHGAGMLSGLGESSDGSPPTSSRQNVQSPPPVQPQSQQPPKFDDASPKSVDPVPSNFFAPYPDPKRRVPSNASSVSQLRFPHFGSDPAFKEQFQRASDAPTYADIRSDIVTKTKFAFQTERNTDNSPPTSPYTTRRPSMAQGNMRGQSADSDQSGHDRSKVNAKRRRIGSSQEISSTSDEDRPSELEGQDDDDDMPRNRRKSSSAAANRRNLTEEQRRQNHNKSEQRRRTVITDDLTLVRNLVPALINTTASKAIAIRETYQFLNELLESNKELEHILGPQIAGTGPYPSADYMRPDAAAGTM